MKNLYLYLSLLVLFFAFGCATVPKNASVLSTSVNQGIENLQKECEVIIHTLGDVERGILDEEWEEIYDRVEEKYRQTYSIPSGQALTRDETIDIATGAAAVREDLLKAIAEKEEALISKTRENAQKVININDQVRRYLLSLEEYDQATSEISELADELTGIDPKRILGTVDSNIQHSIDDFYN